MTPPGVQRRARAQSAGGRPGLGVRRFGCSVARRADSATDLRCEATASQRRSAAQASSSTSMPRSASIGVDGVRGALTVDHSGSGDVEHRNVSGKVTLPRNK